ncbi:MAG: ABC transporter permease [Clostridiales Family XIII bacterium]|jgi:peptide/nickel transport system permease protein|nr:ABC transporter permease [Clostridiales Family XIII bacterium]
MTRFIGKRILTAILCIFVALCLNFIIIHAAPGDPIRILVGPNNTSPELVEELTKKYGLDQPEYVQFLRYLGNLARGDLGTSIYTGEDVTSMIWERMGPTALLALTAAVLALIIGTAIGIFSGRRVGSKLDSFIGSVSYLFDAMPVFWLGLMLILIFASILGILPTAGMVDIRADNEGFLHVLDVMKHMILPVSALTLTLIPYYMRIARSAVVQVIGEDFITTLRATGMPESRIYRKYVFRNAILPTITVFGIHMAYLVTGSAIVEIVFSWPGMGSFVMTAISRRDYSLLMGIYFILSVSVAVMMIVVDLVYAALDPRIRHAKS